MDFLKPKMLPRLSTLCMKVLENRVSSITLKLLELSTDYEVDFDSKYLDPTCRKLEEIISGIPCSLANEVTDKLLHTVMFSYQKFLSKESVELKILLKHNTSFIVDVACSVLHPYTTIFCYADWCYSEHIGSDSIYQFIVKALDKMRCIESLRLEVYSATKVKRNCIRFAVKDQTCLRKVEELTVYGLGMYRLHRQFQGLKKLVIGQHSFKSWQDADINILQLGHLEYLDVVDMKLNQEQVRNLIEGLSITQAKTQKEKFTKGHPLKVFKFESMQNTVSLVVSHFPYLTSVKIVVISLCNLTVLKGLRQLKSLDICSKTRDTFQSILGEFLKECGNRLQELKLANIYETDLKFVAQHCPSLQKLCLYDCDGKFFREPPLFKKIFPKIKLRGVYEFPSVQTFQFNIHLLIAAEGDAISHIISKCVNVQVIQVKIHNDFTLMFLKKLAKNLGNMQFEIHQEVGDVIYAKGDELWGVLNYRFPKWMLT
ncbi:hypothetical protein C0J52_25841 [Blattella germanica]|nr:hypothetical protein C0J52_25841 [Blattella germanica]